MLSSARAFALFCTFFASCLNAFRATAIAMAVPGEIEHSLDQRLGSTKASVQMTGVGQKLHNMIENL